MMHDTPPNRNIDTNYLETTANLRVTIMNEKLDIEQICTPLEQMGWIIESAWIEEEED